MQRIITNFSENWGIKLSISLLTLLLCNLHGVVSQEGNSARAQGDRPIFRSASGDTSFPAAAQSACAGQVVWYNTCYQGIAYHRKNSRLL